MSESDKSGKPELDAAIEFLEQECKSYEPFTPHGLNKLPHVLFESVGKAMVNYSAHENRAAQARIAELEAISKALIKTLQVSLPIVSAPLRETFEIAIAKAKDKLLKP